ncbi:ABC-2 type transport system ATP-binding protein [Allonocardiopsis opalescens]|uniref:ABC-2 type transport system ATP-binding protein n=1 Tax=Allonocardiopsis opalescens TaxID=1144618 RepID=A0A2T0Q1P7_9ACTN|nr:ATP-binding cassette domain-containing protein [Allonocardiopsis opalescens]PRX97726.1 ABC-2 type transport system ATP-binding protein [Allonocardiopsis opalescens]
MESTISVEGLGKRYGATVAVRDLSFTVEPGKVTGFLGPNGAGKSTTMRVILGLDRPTTGRALIAGVPYASIPAPTRVVGSLLDAGAVHPGRTARAHLGWIARASGVDLRRVGAALDRVGIAHAADRPAAALSLGMRQRLGLAAALLGDPSVLILDEPLNGLDPQGIVWLRGLLKEFADAGGTVLVSSHLMNEMQATADHVIVIARGELLASVGVAELAARTAGSVRVDGPGARALVPELRQRGARVEHAPATPDAFDVTGLDPLEIGRLALGAGVALRELAPRRTGLEAAFMDLTTSERTSG